MSSKKDFLAHKMLSALETMENSIMIMTWSKFFIWWEKRKFAFPSMICKIAVENAMKSFAPIHKNV